MLPHQFAGGGFRKLLARETAALRAHLMRLSRDDRRLRFCGQVSDKRLARYAEDRGPFEAVVLGWFVDGELRAAGELLFPRGPAWGGRCEVALSVEGPYQNRGVATELLRRLVVIARNRGVASLVMWCLAENQRMRAVAAKLGAALELHASEVEGRLTTPWPTQLTLLEEAVADGAAVLGFVFGLEGQESPRRLPVPA